MLQYGSPGHRWMMEERRFTNVQGGAMRKLSVITLMGIAIVGGSGLMAVAGETKAQVEKAKGEMKADYQETKGEAKGLTEDVKGNKTKAEYERAKGKVKGGGERVKGKTKELKARAE